jgi:thiamine pyrophosphokinase
MIRPIVHDMRPVTLVGGGKVKKSLLNAAIVYAPKIVAADGAADQALRHDHIPDAVIGDFDSISPAARAAIPAARLHQIAEQDSTDFEKCLSRIDAPLIIGVGFGGGRLDHQLAALHGLLRYPERPCLLLGKRDIVFLAPPKLRIDLPRGTRLSLFPMGKVAAGSDGLRWPLDGIGFAPGARIGTSNRVDGPVRIDTDRPEMLIILPAGQLDRVVRVLSAPGAPRWPARSGQ